MGYYENPPIIQPNRGGEIIAASITEAASDIAKGLIKAGEERRALQKERRLTVQKLQDKKNESDLLYNEKMSKWSSKQSHTADALDSKIYNMAQEKITLAADSNIALLNETDATKRQEYLSNIKNANQFLDASASFGTAIAEQTATFRLAAKAIKIGKPGGYIVNGATDNEIEDNTAALEILGGMDGLYKDTNIDVTHDTKTGGILLNVKGKHKDGREFNVVIDSKKYEKSSEELGDGLLLPVETLDTFHTQAKEGIVDKKGNIYDGYLNPTRETVDLPSKGTSGGVGRDIYQITNGQRLQDRAIKAAIDKKSDITATGIMSADNPSRLRAMLDYTLEKGIGYYDDVFKKITSPEEQKKILKDILTEKAFNEMTKDLETTTGANGEKVYWNPTADIKLKDKPSLASVTPKEVKEEPTTYKTDYYRDIIHGYTPGQGERLQEGQIKYRTRKGLVENLNKLSGSADKYMTREDLYTRWKAQPYKEGTHVSGNTIEEEYKKKGKDVKAVFDKMYPKAHVFVEDGANAYKPLKGYDVNTATGRVKLALDQTSDAGERKILQKTLGEAKLMDWVKANPRRQGESEQAYANRASKSL